MSKRVIFTLASATVLAAVIPGFAGYVTAQYEALDQARAELARLQTQLRMMEFSFEPAAATPCHSGIGHGRRPGPMGEDEAREVIPPRTHIRSWHNTAYVQAATPTLWPSIVVPTALPGPRVPENSGHPNR